MEQQVAPLSMVRACSIRMDTVRFSLPLFRNVVTYDPSYAYEVAVIIQDGLRRMYVDNESIYYYLTLYNENYSMPPMPEGIQQGIVKGMYRLRSHNVNSPQLSLVRNYSVAGRFFAKRSSCRRDLVAAIWCGDRRLECHELQGTPPRCPGVRTLESKS